MGTFLLLMALFNDQPVLANIAGKGVAGVFAFFLHRHFTFQSTGAAARFKRCAISHCLPSIFRSLQRCSAWGCISSTALPR
ncbi:GtrA family protein [Pseudomonas brassicacearum]